ncbi:hypothetical protein EG328_006638 [Venturia inaequalis]|uniref:Uncharacterized protein n=1 Tax=Venturia inaequalis TaxID=5025 RepID=A0A8H3VXL3_VENIN|nr:hypothetical protein EG328_006638 [Venturia inaequalis]KAE9994683.1 hypothetical protein EG327_005129 [Venturia inaequalis]RDI79923.1 hypothetical protein Vi05172_g9966 [Venturia inaequalis]
MSEQNQKSVKEEQAVTQQEEQGEELEEKNEQGPTQKSSITPKIYAPKNLPEFDKDDEVGVTSFVRGATRKVVATVVERRANSRGHWEYRLSSPADSSKWYAESELVLA